jgi:hypothetical protein
LQGGWKNGKFHGRGIMYESNGNLSEGEWKEGLKHGEFVLTELNGKRYNEKYENNKEVDSNLIE